MSTVLRSEHYRFFFYNNEGSEPAHIHVRRDQSVAKFWLEPVAVAATTGYAWHEVRTLTALVQLRRAALIEAWDEYFRSSK